MIDMLKRSGASHIKVFGGGGGVIVPAEIRSCMLRRGAHLLAEDGARLGLQGHDQRHDRCCDQNLAEKPLALDALKSATATPSPAGSPC